jgi:hypothetical protein
LTAAELNFGSRYLVRAFAGQNSRGERYGGGGVLVKLGGEEARYRQELGLAAFLREAGPLVTRNLYLFYEGTLRTDEWKVDRADRVRLHAEAMLYVAALVGSIDGAAQGGHYAADARAALALEALFGRRTDRVTGSLRVEGQITPGVGDIRDVSTARLQVDQIVTEGTLFFALSQSPEGRAELEGTAAGRAYLYGVLTTMLDHWGARGVARVGLDAAGFGVEGRLSGRVQDESPIFRPAAIRELGLRLSVKLGARSIAYAEATRPLKSEKFEDIGPQFRVGGQAILPRPGSGRR